MLITDIVLAETVWVLRGSKYSLGKADLVRLIHGLTDDAYLTFESRETVLDALHDYEQAKRVHGKDLDFADALIVRKAKHWARARDLEIDGVYSFDKAASQLDGVRGL